MYENNETTQTRLRFQYFSSPIM